MRSCCYTKLMLRAEYLLGLFWTGEELLIVMDQKERKKER